MAGRRPSNLTRRQGVYYFRGFIPRAVTRFSRSAFVTPSATVNAGAPHPNPAPALRRADEKSNAERHKVKPVASGTERDAVKPAARPAEVRISLRTQDIFIARKRLRPIALAFESLCGQLRAMVSANAPDEDIRTAVQSFGATLLASSAPPVFSGPSMDCDFARARFRTLEEISALEHAIACNSLDDDGLELDTESLGLARRHAEQLVKSRFADVKLTQERLALLRMGVARAQLEEQRHYLRRLDDPFAPLVVTDPLFLEPPAPTSPVATKSPTFAEAVAQYIQAKSGIVWTARTEEENRRVLRFAAEHFGAATTISAITLDNVRAFRDSVIAWRRKPPPAAKLADIANAPPQERINAKTAAKYFQYLSAAFSHWTNEGYLEKSPVGKLTVPVPHQVKATARTPFTPGDLKALFSSPIFAGCAGPQRRTVAGPHLIRDGFYWALLIAPLSGMRITEIVQLALDDICFDDEIPAFRIKADAALGQAVKSDAGWRRVPIHRRLIELGFREFVTARQAAAQGGRLFDDIHISNTGGSGGELSKLFGRTMRRLKLKRPGLVFHSFRHGFVDALRELDAPEYVIKRIVGHSSGSVTDGYGAGASLKTCKNWIDKIGLLDALPPEKSGASSTPHEP